MFSLLADACFPSTVGHAKFPQRHWSLVMLSASELLCCAHGISGSMASTYVHRTVLMIGIASQGPGSQWLRVRIGRFHQSASRSLSGHI